jgi:integrase
MPSVYFRFRKELFPRVRAAQAARAGGEKASMPKELAPENGRWWLDYVGATGKRKQEKCDARTKGEAELLLLDVARRAERMRRGLEVEGPKPITFADAAKAYRASIRHLSSYPDIDAQLRLYLEPALGRKLMQEITPAMCDAVLSAVEDELAPATRKGLLLRIGAVYRWATRKGDLYRGHNPVQAATPVRVPERIPRFLSEEQLTQLLTADTSDIFVILFAVLTGLRKGEVAGLKWVDVDLERALLTVRRSYDRRTTKGKKDRLVPVPRILLQQLELMSKGARSTYVFPAPDGSMRTEHGWDAAENFKSAMRAAGLVSGYMHKCRRTGCCHQFESPAKEPMPCPKCSFRTWPVGIALDFSFKDLRSTYATHLAMASRDIRLVQRLLGHTRPEITERAYAATTVDYLRQGVETLPLARDKGVTQAALPVGKVGETESEAS